MGRECSKVAPDPHVIFCEGAVIRESRSTYGCSQLCGLALVPASDGGEPYAVYFLGTATNPGVGPTIQLTVPPTEQQTCQ